MANLLFGQSPLPNVSTSESSTTGFPTWYSQWLNQLYGKASGVAGEQYQPYKGPRIAPFSDASKQSFSSVQGAQGAWQPNFNAGVGMTAAAGNPSLNSDVFSSYMNPYVSGVVDRIGELAGRNLSENLLPGVNDSFIRGGQFGSSRNADFTLRALRDTNESALAQQNQALAQGFGTAMNAYQSGQDRQLQAGNQLGSLSQLGQGLRYQDAAALQGIGQLQEDKTQQSLNTAYGDFLTQRDYPRSQVEWLSSVLRGYNPGTTVTSTSTGPGTSSQMAPNPLAQVAGAGLGLYGLTNGFQFRKGGKAKKPVTRKKMPPMREKPAQVAEEPGIGGISQWREAA